MIVVGAGSGNMLFGPELEGLRSAIIEPDWFGDTCLNRGCIPSKMLVVAADTARTAREAGRLGVHATVDRVDWPAIRDRVFGRIDPIHDHAVDYRRRTGVDVYTAPARFVAPRVLEVDGDRLTADQVVVAGGLPARGAGGSRARRRGVPHIGHHHAGRRCPRVAARCRGGFIAAEMVHVFDAFGSSVTIVQRGPRLLTAEDEAVSARFTEVAGHRFRLLLEARVVSVEPRGSGVAVTFSAGGAAPRVIEASALLVAAGRQPNTDRLDAAAGSLAVDDHGHLITDECYRTSVPGVWALGDAANHFQLKHMANAEMRVVRHNLTHPGDLRRLPAGLVPHAVFSDPRVAGVGLTEQDARHRGIDVVAVRRFADTAYGWALQDTTGFVKLLADQHRRTLLGAHIIGPHAAMLLQPLVQAMMLGQTVDQVGRDVLYVHPALTEVTEQALLEL